MRILVTGGTGFIGRHAVRALLEGGHSVVCAARSPQRKIPADWITSDLLMPGEPERVVRDAKADAILHLAWTTEHGKYWTDPVNLEWVSATKAIAKAAIEHGMGRFCAAGTCFEYEWPSDSDCDETTTPLANHLLYDTTKNTCRSELEAITSHAGMSFAWGRLFFLYGPFEHPARLASSVARSLIAGQPAKCSNGVAIRDFMDARDAGAALAALAVSDVKGSVNIASGEAKRVADVAKMLGEIYGRPDLVCLGALPDRENDPPRITASVDRLRSEVGFRNSHSLRSGLSDALDFWAKNSAC